MTEIPAGDWLLSQMYKQARSRKKKPMTSQRKRRSETLRWRKARKLELWEAATRNCAGFSLTRWGVALPNCPLCGYVILKFTDCELDHKIPVRRGGDTDENTHLVHTLGNRAKGSISLEKYLELSLETRRKNCGVIQ